MCAAAGRLHDQSMAMPRRCIAARRRGCEYALTMRCSPSINATDVRLRHDDPGAARRLVVDVDDGVVQPTDVGHQRQRAVPHRLHLGEAARLEAARHDEDVGAGEQLVGQRLVVAADERNVLRVGARPPRSSASASACSPSPSTISVAPRRCRNGVSGSSEVDALLIDEPGDHRQQRPAAVDAGRSGRAASARIAGLGADVGRLSTCTGR